jgi:hypothetical protein
MLVFLAEAYAHDLGMRGTESVAAFRRRAMSDDIGPLAVWAVQHLGHHHGSLSHR